MGRGCREIRETQYVLERQDAEKLIADTKKNVDMDTDESFSAHELSVDVSVTQSTDGAGAEDDTEMDISSEEASYTDYGKETSEEIESDADMDVHVDKQAVISELSDQRWQSNEIAQWSDWQDSLSGALQKTNIADNMVGAVMDQAPYIRLMYDSGTFKHLVGRGTRALMINIRDLPKPCRLNTASKTLWIKEACDLLLNGVIIRGCLINPSDMKTTLLSEGVLALFEKWEFHMDWKGKEVTMPDGNKHWGWRESSGVLFYVPPELLPNRHEDANQLNGQYEQQMEELDYEIDQIERMQEIEQRLKEENGSDAMTRSQAAKKDKDGITWMHTTQGAAEAAKEVESAVGLHNGQINGMPMQIVDVTDGTTDKIEITDMCAAGLHKPKMKGCDICEQAYMQAEPASLGKHDTAEPTTDNDNMIMTTEPVIIGDIYFSSSILAQDSSLDDQDRQDADREQYHLIVELEHF